MNLGNFEFSREKQILASRIVILDGFSGTGKALISPLISYLERNEQWQISTFFDDITALFYINGIYRESAEALIRLESDRIIYNLTIGRNVNYRKADASSPFFNGLSKIYKERSLDIEGDSVIQRLREFNPILPIHIHYKFGYTDLLYSALKDRPEIYILCMKNPFYLIERQYEQDWVNKIPNNDRVSENCIKYKNEEVPWFVREYCDDYAQANDFEKSILTVYHFFMKSFDRYKNMSEFEKRKTLIVPFEDLIQQPMFYIKQISNLVESKPNDNFDKMMKKLSLPRDGQELSTTTMAGIIVDYGNLIGPRFLKKLENLAIEYENFLRKHCSNPKLYS